MKKLWMITFTLLLVLCNLAGAWGSEAQNYDPAKHFSPVDWSKQKDLGRAITYNMLSVSFTAPPQVTVSNHLLRVGQDNQVSITVQQNDLPLADATLYIDDEPYGPTDSNGQVTVTLNPGNHGNISLVVGDFEFVSELLAVNGDEGVVQVSAVDRAGNAMRDASVYFYNPDLEGSVSDWGGVIRFVAKQGQNELVYTKRGVEGEPGYYLYQTVDVAAGRINQVIFDGAVAVAANLNYRYNSDLMEYVDIFLDKTGKDWDFSWQRRKVAYAAAFDQYTVYVTPGYYDIFFDGFNQAGEYAYLGEQSVHIGAETSLTYNWTDADTGLLNFSTSFDSSEKIGGKMVVLNGQRIILGSFDTVRLNPGWLYVDEVVITDNNFTSDYYFGTTLWDRDIIKLYPGSSASYSIDLDMNGLQVVSNTGQLRSGGSMTALFSTVSGYKLLFINGGTPGLNVSITDPAGKEVIFKDGFLIRYDIPSSAPSGQYELTVAGELGSLYGSMSDALVFDVMAVPKVSVTPNMVPLNEPTNVTVTVIESDGSPMANESVVLGNYEYIGTTNELGQVVFSVNQSASSVLGIQVQGTYFNGLLFALDFASQGVLELTVNDIANNFMVKDFCNYSA